MVLSCVFCGLFIVCNSHNVSELQLTFSCVSVIPLLNTAECTSNRSSCKYWIKSAAVCVNRKLVLRELDSCVFRTCSSLLAIQNDPCYKQVFMYTPCGL